MKDSPKSHSSKIKGFVLCAGLGTRLRPITEKIPKPLLPFLGNPLLSRIFKKLKRAGLKEIGINVHHLPERFFEFLRREDLEGKLFVSFEREILGTGGALKKAEPFLRGSSILVHNGDIYTDFDLRELVKFHFERKNLATLLVLENPKENRLFLDEEGNLIGVEGYLHPKSYFQKKGFAGIALYEPEFLKFLTPTFSSVVLAWIEAIQRGLPIKTLELKGGWFDLGTPEGYLSAIKYALKKRGENLFVCEGGDTTHLEFQGFVSIESPCSFEEGTFLEDVIVLKEGKISGSYSGGILFEGGFILAKLEKNLPEEIGFGGSERRFFRTARGVLMKEFPISEDFERTYRYTFFLREKGIRVPKVLEANPEKGELLFEDLGDVSLYSFLKGKKDKELIFETYVLVLDEVIKLHTLSLESAPPFRVFDYEHFLWENTYFQEKFLLFLCGLEPTFELKKELEDLARLCDTFPKYLIHRDLQSQNVMLKKGRPYLIDYQGARLGPAGYDLASLLWDPYYELEEDLKFRLIEYYLEERALRDKTFSRELLLESLLPLRIQRHLQALAAYVNLSYFKGKRHFLKFIPRALEYLFEEVKIFGLRELEKALYSCKEALIKKGFYEELEELSE